MELRIDGKAYGWCDEWKAKPTDGVANEWCGERMTGRDSTLENIRKVRRSTR